MFRLLRMVQYVTAVLCLFHPFLGVLADVPHSTDLEAYQNGTTQPMQNFFSAPQIWAPIFQVNKFDYDKADKTPFMFMSGNYSKTQGHFNFHIFSSKDLSLVYSFEEGADVIRVIRPYIFKGIPVLGFWARRAVWIMNQHYKILYKTVPQGDRPDFLADPHEAFLTDHETVIAAFREIVHCDVTAVGGPKEGNGLENSLFTEINPVTGEKLFEFSALDHFNLTDSYWKYGVQANYDPNDKNPKYDAFHLNSIEKTPEGDYLVSARHLHAIFLVDGKKNTLKWVMGGKKNQFRDITVNGSAKFTYQHNPRLIAPNRILLFDNVHPWNNFCDPKKQQCSRAIEIEFDLGAMTIKLVNEWYHPQNLVSGSRGGVQRLPNGGTLIAWGQNPMYTEYDADGELVMDFQRGPVEDTVHGYRDNLAFRIWKGDWEGKPGWGPNISVNGQIGQKKAYVSWNGATNVEKWVLLMSGSLTDLDGPSKVRKELPRMGFETSFDLPEVDETLYVRIAALDKNDNVIGSTPAAELWNGKLHRLDYQVTQVKVENPQSHKGQPAKNSPAKTNPSSKRPSMYEMASEMTSEAFYVTAGVALGFLALFFLMLRKRRSGLYRLRRLITKEKAYGEE